MSSRSHRPRARDTLSWDAAGVLFVVMGLSFVVFQGSSAFGGADQALGLSDLTQRIETALIGVR